MADEVTTETEAQLPTMYVDDDVDDNAGEATDPEQVDETPEGEADPDDEGQGEQEEAEGTDDPEPDPEPEKPKGMDVALQKLQQRQTAFEQKMAGISESVQQVLEALNKRGGDAQATPKQEEKIEQAQDDLADLLKGVEDDDLVSAAQLRGILKQLNRPQASATDGEKVKQLEQTIAQLQEQLGTVTAQTKEQVFYAGFDAQHPELKGKGPDLLANARQMVANKYPNLEPGSDAYQIALNENWDRVLADAKAKAKPTEPASPKPKVDPAKTTPNRSAKGTQTVPTGASTSRPTTSPKREKPRMYIPDDEV